MGIKTNELQQLSSILGTDSLLADSAAAGTGRIAAAALAQFMDAELLKSGTGLSTQLGNKADKSAQQTLEAVSVPTRTVTLTAAELQSYINALPRYLSEVIQLTVAGGEITQTLVLDYFSGPGYLSLSGKVAGGNLQLKQGIIIRHCTAAIQIYSCELSGISTQSNPDVCANVYDSRYVYFGQCCFAGNNDSNSCALISDHSSQVTLNECTISGWNRAALAMTASTVNVHDCTCSGNTNGAQVWGGGIVLLSGTTPELMGGVSNLLHGGLIVKRDGTPYAPLEWHDLPLPNGWTGPLRYARVLNTVYLQMSAETSASPGIGSLVLSTLPEGCRPKYTVFAAGVDVSSSTVMTITAATDGQVLLYPYVGDRANWHGTRGSIVFPVP